MNLARSPLVRLILLLASLPSSACQKEPPAGDPSSADLSAPADLVPPRIRLLPGVGTDSVRIGGTYAEARRAFGPGTCMPESCAAPQGYARVNFAETGLTALFAASDAVLQDGDVLLALSTADARIDTPVPLGIPAAEAMGKLGGPLEGAGTVWSSSRGASFAAGPDGNVASVSVFAPYVRTDKAPEMTTAQEPVRPPAQRASWPRYKLDGEEIDVVDMHLHAGSFGMLAAGQRSALAMFTPPFLQPFLPAFINAVSDAYSPGVGMLRQAQRAGFSHGVIYAVWTPYTSGWFPNDALSQILYSPRNVTLPDGKLAFYGFASVFFDDFDKEPVRSARCAALESFLAKQGDRMIGIKLAHTHQRVRLDDTNTRCVFDAAKKYGKPIAMHTGLTPIAGALNEPAAYDPSFFESMVKLYPEVSFVLLHVGQGDRRATRSALDLTSRYPNVSLEISALGRPLVLDETGTMVMTMEPQFPYVLAEIKKRGLISRTLWGSDGPQTPGYPAQYLDRIVAEMRTQSYSNDQIKAVLAGNFYRVFKL